MHTPRLQWEQRGGNVLWHRCPRLFFLDIWDICVFHVRCSSTCTPRDLVDPTYFIKTLSILRAGDRSNVPNLCLDPITINSALDLLRVSLFATNQLLTLMRSWFSFCSIISTLLPANVRCVSSAYIWRSEFSRQLGRSLIYKINRSGPKIVPWGIPKARDLLSEIEPLTTHFWVRIFKYDLKRLYVESLIP